MDVLTLLDRRRRDPNHLTVFLDRLSLLDSSDRDLVPHRDRADKLHLRIANSHAVATLQIPNRHANIVFRMQPNHINLLGTHQKSSFGNLSRIQQRTLHASAYGDCR